MYTKCLYYTIIYYNTLAAVVIQMAINLYCSGVSVGVVDIVPSPIMVIKIDKDRARYNIMQTHLSIYRLSESL